MKENILKNYLFPSRKRNIRFNILKLLFGIKAQRYENNYIYTIYFITEFKFGNDTGTNRIFF